MILSFHEKSLWLDLVSIFFIRGILLCIPAHFWEYKQRSACPFVSLSLILLLRTAGVARVKSVSLSTLLQIQVFSGQAFSHTEDICYGGRKGELGTNERKDRNDDEKKERTGQTDRLKRGGNGGKYFFAVLLVRLIFSQRWHVKSLLWQIAKSKEKEVGQRIVGHEKREREKGREKFTFNPR